MITVKRKYDSKEWLSFISVDGFIAVLKMVNAYRPYSLTDLITRYKDIKTPVSESTAVTHLTE